MIPLKETLVEVPAGSTWNQTGKTTGKWGALCISNGRIIIGGRASNTLGIYYSNDHGATFQSSNKTSWQFYDFYEMMSGRILAAASNYGVLYSDDQGETWDQTEFTGKTVYAFHRIPPAANEDPGGPGTILAGTNSGIYIANPMYDGIEWEPSNKTSGDVRDLCSFYYKSDATGVSISDTPLDGHTLRIIAAVRGAGIWYSDDRGINWYQSNKNSGYTMSLCIKGSRLFAGSEGSSDNNIYYSDDGGNNWTSIQNSPAGILGLVLDRNRIIACSGYDTFGICYSDDNGMTWTQGKSGGSNKIYINNNTVLVGSNDGTGVWESHGQSKYLCNKPLDQKGIKALIEECKAYVQSKKQS